MRWKASARWVSVLALACSQRPPFTLGLWAMPPAMPVARGRFRFSVDQVADLHLERFRESHDDAEAWILAPTLELGQVHAGDAGPASERLLGDTPFLSNLPQPHGQS